MTKESSGYDGIPREIKQEFYNETVNGSVIGIMTGGTINQYPDKNNDHIDITALAEELANLKEKLLETRNAENAEDTDISVGEVSNARKLLNEGKKPDAFKIIRGFGNKVLDIAKEISCKVIVAVIDKKF